MDNLSREKTIVRTGVIGIVANVLLASFKALVGLAVHSTAMAHSVNKLAELISKRISVGAEAYSYNLDRYDWGKIIKRYTEVMSDAK